MSKPQEIIGTLYPVVYGGPKEVKSQLIPQRNGALPFVLDEDPDSRFFGLKVAYATELEARWIAKNCTGGEFTFPAGLRNPDDKEDLWARISALEEKVAGLIEQLTAPAGDVEPAKRTRKTPVEAITETVAV